MSLQLGLPVAAWILSLFGGGQKPADTGTYVSPRGRAPDFTPGVSYGAQLPGTSFPVQFVTQNLPIAQSISQIQGISNVLPVGPDIIVYAQNQPAAFQAITQAVSMGGVPGINAGAIQGAVQQASQNVVPGTPGFQFAVNPRTGVVSY